MPLQLLHYEEQCRGVYIYMYMYMFGTSVHYDHKWYIIDMTLSGVPLIVM